MIDEELHQLVRRIDELHTKLDDYSKQHELDMIEVKEHMKSVEPILQAYTGGKAIGGLVKWSASLVTACGILWLALKGVFIAK